MNIVMFVCQCRTETVLPQLCEREPVRVRNVGSTRWSPLPAGGGTAVLRRLLPGAPSLHHNKKLTLCQYVSKYVKQKLKTKPSDDENQLFEVCSWFAGDRLQGSFSQKSRLSV